MAGRKPKPLRDRLLASVEPLENGCWQWKLSCDKDGYGFTSIGGRVAMAHVVAYEEFHGPRNGRHVLHSCDNPGCVNPTHLVLGTHRDNMADMIRKGRQVAVCGEQVGSAKLTAIQVAEIRARYAAGGIATARLGVEYGVTGSAIWKVVTHRSWQGS